MQLLKDERIDKLSKKVVNRPSMISSSRCHARVAISVIYGYTKQKRIDAKKKL